MCGICGVVRRDRDAPVSRDLIKSMCGVMTHRGPDDEGHFFGGHVALGMRRLKVVDLETGSQPMSSDDGRVVIVFNGEIYNYLELRDDLAARGHRFRTRSDTEVILRLYEDRGEACLDLLDGMFAIAIWDGRRDTLFLARDRLGEKPLHYCARNGDLLFSSEIKSILCSPDVDRGLDRESTYLYFVRNCVPAPRTIYSSIKKLLPGHFLKWKDGAFEIFRYWDVPFRPDRERTEDDLCRDLRCRLETLLRRRMNADVPLGAFLSGGIDSSVVVALMSSLSNRPVKTFSIGFSEDSHDELRFARVVAERFATEHHEFVVKPNAIELVDKLAFYFDEPFGGPSAVPTFIVSELARKHVTVAITGDGGDELFGGYLRFEVALRQRPYTAIPGPLRRFMATRVADRLPDGARGKRFLQSLCLDEWFLGTLSAGWKKRIFSPAFRAAIERVSVSNSFQSPPAGGGADYLGKYLYWDTKNYLPDDVLVKVDRASMANSLETRTLFLAHELVEFAATIPSSLKIRNGETKYLLKKAMRDLLPAEILGRGKWGFALPVAVWFRKELKETIRSLIESGTDDEVFDLRFLKTALDQHLSGARDHHKLLWSFLMFRFWERQWAGWKPPQPAP